LGYSSIIEARLNGEAKKKQRIREMKKTRIKECCASCRHKTVRNDGSRICQLMQIVVTQQMKCPKWDIAEGLRRFTNL
jgi:hypothetical protein